jgi:hypothetical protein
MWDVSRFCFGAGLYLRLLRTLTIWRSWLRHPELLQRILDALHILHVTRTTVYEEIVSNDQFCPVSR